MKLLRKQRNSNFNGKKIASKTKNFCFIYFLLITLALLIAVSIYHCFKKYWAKHLLPFYVANNKLDKLYLYNENCTRYHFDDII